MLETFVDAHQKWWLFFHGCSTGPSHMGRLSLTDVPMTHAFGDRSLRGQRRGRRPIPVLKPSRIEELEKVGRDGGRGFGEPEFVPTFFNFPFGSIRERLKKVSE
jgi:hypothetical protein